MLDAKCLFLHFVQLMYMCVTCKAIAILTYIVEMKSSISWISFNVCHPFVIPVILTFICVNRVAMWNRHWWVCKWALFSRINLPGFDRKLLMCMRTWILWTHMWRKHRWVFVKVRFLYLGYYYKFVWEVLTKKGKQVVWAYSVWVVRVCLQVLIVISL